MSFLLSIIIPVYKDLHGLKQTIQGLKDSIEGENHQWIVCNDGADKGISDWVNEQGIEEVSIAHQRGSYFARNRGIEKSRHSCLLFADAGIVIKPGWMPLLQDHFSKSDYVAFEISIQSNPTDSLIKQYSIYTEFQCDYYWKNQHFGPTAFLGVKKSVFEETGLFDEEVFSGGDLELGNRCWHANLPMSYVKNKFILHAPRGLKAKLRKHIRVMRGQQTLKAKYPNRLTGIEKLTGKGLLYVLLRTLKKMMTVRRSPAVKNGDFSAGQAIWCEFWHELVYFLAYLVVLIKKKP